MQCPNCDGSVESDSRECHHCGAQLAPRRVILGKKEKEFSLTPEEEPFELGDYSDTNEGPFHFKRMIDLVDEPDAYTRGGKESIAWGGFMRRAWAFLIDCAVILLLASVMFMLSYVGYKVGLRAHGKSITWENATPLVIFLTWAGIGLSAAYFIVFHAMNGQTIGKWLLGLRVVGAERAAVTLRQAFVRWLAVAGFAPIVLGFLWVLWSREKRGWHDLLARTWVIRESR